MPAVLAGLAEFAAAALAALEVVASFLLACAAIYMFIGIVRPLFRAVAAFLPGGWKLFGQVIVPDLRGDWLALEGKLYNALLAWRRGTEIQMAFTWHWMAQAWRWNAGMVEWLAKETDASIEWLAHIRVPKWTKYALLAPLLPLLLPKVLRYVMAHVHINVHKQVQVIERTLPGKSLVIVKRAAAVAVPDVWHIPGFSGVWHGLTKRFARINWRLSRLERLLTVAGLAAAMAAVMGVAPSCLKRNGNVGRVARRLCGLAPHALEDLLGLIADVLLLENICTVIGYLESGLALIEPELTAFIATAEKQFVHCKYVLPGNNTVASPDVPPLTGLTLNPV